MTVLFISRHPGARAWASTGSLPIDKFVDHLDVSQVHMGDTVIGSLPVHLAAAVCGRGARYVHLCLAVDAEDRGRELTEAEMREREVHLQEYLVQEVDTERRANNGPSRVVPA